MFSTTHQRVKGKRGDLITSTQRHRGFLPMRAEDERNGVRRAKEKLAAMLRVSVAGVVVCRLQDGLIVEANKRWLAMFGVRRSEIVGKVQASWAWKHPEDWKRMVRDLRRGGDCKEQEINFHKANGEDFLALTAAQLTELNGERVIISSMVDITVQRRLEGAVRELTRALEEGIAKRTAALRESELRFRALATASSDVIYRMSPDWTEMRELQGRQFLPDTKKPSRTWLQKYIRREDQTQVLAVIRKAIRTKHAFELEHRVWRKDGSAGWTFSRAIPVFDAKGGIVEWLGMAKDVTKAKQAEGNLRESERRFRQVVESLPQLVWTCAAGGPCDYLSPQWIRYTGKCEADQLGYGWLRQLHPDDRSRVRKQWGATADKGENFESEFRIRRHDGAYRWFRTLAVPLRDESGRVVEWFGSNTDIDAIKQAEVHREQVLAEFNATVSCMADGLMVFKPDGGLAYMNPAAKRLLDCPPQDGPRSLADWFKYIAVTREDGTPLLPKDSLTVRALRGETVWPMVLSLRFSGGRTIWVQASAAAMRTANGECLGAVTVFADITERKKVETALRESEVRFRTIFNAAGDGMFLMDLQLARFHLANPACLDMLGYTIQEFTNLRIQDLHRREDRPFVRAQIEKLRTGGFPERAEVLFRRKDGRFILAEASPTTVSLAGREYALVVLRDVTRSRQVERERALLAAIVESSNDAIYAIDAKGIFTAWAAGAERLYGYSLAETVGKSIGLIVPRDRRGEIPMLLEKLKQGEVVTGFETVRVCKDGKRIPVSVTISPMRDAAGQNVGWSVISRDISERKRLEMQLLEVGEREQHRLGHDLHDGLAQELHGLCYLAKLLEKELKRELPARAPEAKRLGKVLGEAFHLTRSLAHGLRPVSPVPEGLMASLRKLTQRTRDLYGIDCRFECRRPVLIRLHSAATHLYRIAQEAVNNAIRHGHPKEIRIQLAITPQKIILGIRDDGVGLRWRNEGHRGMGLHIMQYRAETIRGSLVVQRQRAGGTEVVCTVAREALHQLKEPNNEGIPND